MRDVVAKAPSWPAGWTILGVLADRVGDYATGVEAGKRAVELLLAEGRKAEAARAQLRLAHRHFRFGNSRAQLEAQIRARDLQKEAGLDTSQADATIAEIEGRIRERPDPPARLREVVERARKDGDARAEHAALVRLAYALYLAKQFDEGLACYRRVLLLHDAFACPNYQKANDQNGAARLALELALESPERKQAELLAQAKTWAESALAAHSSEAGVTIAPLVWDHCVLAHIAIAQGQGDARSHFLAERAFVLKEREGLSGEDDRALRIFNGERFHIFEDFALFLSTPDRDRDLEEALRISDEGRVGALEDLLRLRGMRVPAWAAADGMSIASLQAAAAAAHAAIIVFLRGSHEAGTITITGTRAYAARLAAPPRLDEAGRAFLAAVLDVKTRPKDLDLAARNAFATFLDRALPSDAGVTRLIVTGGGAISALPFGAMARPGNAPLAQRYLAAKYEIATAPSLASLLAPAADSRASAPASRPVKVLAAGCNGGGALYDEALAAHYGIAGLRPLQNAEKEAAAMGRAWGGNVLQGSGATESAFRALAPEATLLHVASHAIADETDGSRTALLLFPEPGKSDGILTMGDLLELRLRARLVILSGCRTARGELFSGESIGGLARAVLASGAANLVASVAPVDDQTTPVLVEALGRGFMSGEPVPRALASAQRRMLAEPRTSHPALWAPFVLFGQGDLLK